MKDSTKVLTAGLHDKGQGKPFMPGPVFAAPFHLSGDPSTTQYQYGRYGNPTWTDYENAISELEEGVSTIAFSSGMAAITAVFGSMLKEGDILVMPSDAYYAARLAAGDYFKSHGIDVRFAKTSGNAQLEYIKGAKLLWIETPSNPNLDVCDIQILSEAAHKEGALVAVDNTTATCLGQKPLNLGADFSVSSDTKATTGHSDIILGHVTVKDDKLGEKLRTYRKLLGSIPGPMEVWLAHRSLATLDVRLERQCKNALAIAKFLKSCKEVKKVRYPGLKDDPSYEIASKQMKYFGPIVSFELENREKAEKFLKNCRIVYEATSFGGIHTMAERRARWGGDNVSEGFIRLSAGCEDKEDIIEDLKQAIDKACKL